VQILCGAVFRDFLPSRSRLQERCRGSLRRTERPIAKDMLASDADFPCENLFGEDLGFPHTLDGFPDAVHLMLQGLSINFAELKFVGWRVNVCSLGSQASSTRTPGLNTVLASARTAGLARLSVP
jgi:hypothetical protein